MPRSKTPTPIVPQSEMRKMVAAKEAPDDRITAARLKAAGWVNVHRWWYTLRYVHCLFDVVEDKQGIWKLMFNTHSIRTVTGWADLVSLVSALKGKAE